MKTLIVLLIVMSATSLSDTGVPDGQCDYQAVIYGFSCMPVITRTRVLMLAI